VDPDDQPAVMDLMIASLAILCFLGLLTWALAWWFGQLSY
jgi:hypothetical protein